MTSEEKYYKDLAEKGNADKEQTIHVGHCLEEMMKGPGWKIFLSYAEGITDPKRVRDFIRTKTNEKLKNKSLGVDEKDIMYVVGQADGVENLLLSANRAVAKKNKLVKGK